MALLYPVGPRTAWPMKAPTWSRGPGSLLTRSTTRLTIAYTSGGGRRSFRRCSSPRVARAASVGERRGHRQPFRANEGSRWWRTSLGSALVWKLHTPLCSAPSVPVASAAPRGGSPPAVPPSPQGPLLLRCCRRSPSQRQRSGTRGPCAAWRSRRRRCSGRRCSTRSCTTLRRTR